MKQNLDILETFEPAKVGLNYLAQLHQMNIPYQILRQEANDGSEPRYLLVVQAVNQLPEPEYKVNKGRVSISQPAPSSITR